MVPRSRLQVLDVGHRHLGRAGAEIEPEQGLRANQPAPLDEVVGTELIGLGRVPGAIQDRGSLRLRTDPVEPVIPGNEVAAGIAHDGHAQFLDLARHIRAKALGVGQGRPGLVHTGIDGAAEMLEE